METLETVKELGKAENAIVEIKRDNLGEYRVYCTIGDEQIIGEWDSNEGARWEISIYSSFVDDYISGRVSFEVLEVEGLTPSALRKAEQLFYEGLSAISPKSSPKDSYFGV